MLVDGVVIGLLVSNHVLFNESLARKPIGTFSLRSGVLSRNFDPSDKITVNAAYGKKYEIEVKEHSRLKISTLADGTTDIEVQSGRVDVDSRGDTRAGDLRG